MKLEKILLWTNCWLFLLFGLGFVFLPSLLSEIITGAEPSTASAVTDMRATYGGIALGLSYMFRLCALNDKYAELGIHGVFAVMSALSVSRLFGIVLDGSSSMFIYALLGAELIMACLAYLTMKYMKV